MGVCKRAQVRGIQHVMIGTGLVSYPDAKYAEESADLIADNLEGLPEVSGDEGLSPEEAADVMDQIVDVANEIAEKTGFDRSNDALEKAASAVGIETAAHAHSLALMEKAAGETDVTGDGQHHEQYADGGMAEQDIEDNPSSEIVVPQGTTQFDTSAGAIGAEETQPEAPGYSPPISNEVSKLSSLGAMLKKLSMEGDTASGDGTPGAGTGNPPGRKDLETNIAMPKETVVREQGTTSQKPHIPVPTVANPAAAGVTQESKPTTDVQKDVGKVAAAILAHPDKDAILAKLAKELPPEFLENKKGKDDEDKDDKDDKKSKSDAEEKKDEAKEDEGKKEAALFDVLSQIAAANPA